MAHKTLIGGTAYNITGGKSMVSGTTYNVTGGRTMVGGTGYNISFSKGEATAMLYSDGDFVFQHGDRVEAGKTLTASYTGFEDKSYTNVSSVPWRSRSSMIKNVYCLEEIAPTSMSYWFYSCFNLKTYNLINFNLNNVTNMFYAYYDCRNLTGSPVCGDKVISMERAYFNCTNLTGSPVCGNNVTSMAYAYYNCRNLTGFPVCGNNVTNMFQAYFNCTNLTGSPVCGNNVTSMAYAYCNCTNLTGFPVCGDKVTNVSYAYCNCRNLTGNVYFYSNTITDVRNCFYGKYNYKTLNIYVHAGSTTNTTVHKNTTTSLVGAKLNWIDLKTYQYEPTYGIYIYPVENVIAAAIANGNEEANANAGISNNPIHGGGSN